MRETFPREAAANPEPFTGERLTASVHGQIEVEHYHRYLFSRAFCRDRDVLDVASGEGYGAAQLAQVARHVVGVEYSGATARNAAANGWHELAFLAADIAEAPDLGLFDHGFANPPYHPALGTASPDPARDAARRALPGLFALWAASMGGRLRPRGTLTWIVTAAAVPACIAALTAAGCAPSALLPLWKRVGEDAKLLLLRGVKGGRGGFRVLPGLTLHAGPSGFTPEAEAILRHGSGLAI